MNVFRYVVRRDVLRMRWLAPTVLFLIVVSSFLPYSAPLGGSLGILLIAALILSGWMSVVSIAGDDPGQKTVVAVQAGGLIRARLEEAAAALVVAVGFGWVGLVVAALRAVDVPVTTELATRLAFAAGALLLVSLIGVSAGFALAWPVLERTPLAVTAVSVGCLILVVLPVSPVHGMLVCAAGIDQSVQVSQVVAVTAGSIVVSGALTFIGGYASPRRWRLGRQE